MINTGSAQTIGQILGLQSITQQDLKLNNSGSFQLYYSEIRTGDFSEA